MTSSRAASSTTVPSRWEKLADHDLVYERQRLRTRLFETVLEVFVARYESEGFTRSDLANILGKDPAQITRLLKGPGNWTIDTISDLMAALRAELTLDRRLFEHIPKPNFRHDLAFSEARRAHDVGTVAETTISNLIVNTSSGGTAQVTVSGKPWIEPNAATVSN